MPDLGEKFLPRLKAHSLPGIDLGAGSLYPNYEGYSLLNLPGSICHFLGTPDFGAPLLDQQIIEAIDHPYRRVVLFVLDGLGWYLFQKFLSQGIGTGWVERMDQASLVPLTTVCPSTTSSALTSLWTGASTTTHGIAGYELWLKNMGMVANMFKHAPISFTNDNDTLDRAGFKPETFMPLPTLGPHLVQNGVKPYAFLHHSLARSGFSTMQQSQVTSAPYYDLGDLFISLRNLLNDRPGERIYSYVYWGDLDSLSHWFGPEDERVALEFDTFSRGFFHYFIDRLSAEGRKDTLVLVTADHGQIYTPRNKNYELQGHPEFMQALHIQPTGENRMSILYLRPGQDTFAKEYIEKTWPDQFTLVSSSQVLQSGLLGPGARHPQLEERLGDEIAFARGDAYWWWNTKENNLLGRHGGMTPQEMLVPLYGLPL
jgi:hypothetical protein